MIPSTPHYVLHVRTEGPRGGGRWQFRLQRADAREQIEASDAEPRVRGERLELLTVIRALEALDQPSRVSLVGGSDSLRKGLEYGLPEWRENGWRWEFFGQMVPVKNGDLWQRLDQALRFHRVEHRRWRFDPAHTRAEDLAVEEAFGEGCGAFSDSTESASLEAPDASDGWKEWARRGLRATVRGSLAAMEQLGATLGWGVPAGHKADPEPKAWCAKISSQAM